MHKPKKAAVPFILACILLDILGIGLIIPVLPQLVGDLAGSPDAQAWWLGAMLVSYGLMQFCCAPLLGALSDRFGRRPVLLTGICGLSVMFLVPALSTSLPVLLASRFFGGMFSSNIAVAQAYIADTTTPDNRSVAFGMMGACFGIGFILGPLIGGILGETDLRYPFLLAACLSGINFLYGLFVLPESLKTPNNEPLTLKRCNPLTSLSYLSNLKPIGWLIAVIALASFTQSMIHSTWTLYTNFRFGWTPLNIGLSLVAMGIVSVIVQGFAMRRLISRLGEQRVVLLGLLTGAIAYLAFGLADSGWQLYVIILLNFFSVAVPPTLNAIVSHSVPSQEQGRSLGTISSLNSLMGVLAPTVGTPLLVHTAHQSENTFLAGLIYIFCALLLALALILARKHFSVHGTHH